MRGARRGGKYGSSTTQVIGADAASAPGEQRLAGFRQGRVAAHMIRIGAGVDHIADGLRRDFLDGSDHGICARPGPRVDHHHAIHSDLKADIAAGAGNHIEVRPQLKHLEIRARRLLRHQATHGD